MKEKIKKKSRARKVNSSEEASRNKRETPHHQASRVKKENRPNKVSRKKEETPHDLVSRIKKGKQAIEASLGTEEDQINLASHRVGEPCINTASPIRVFVETFYDLQKVRIETGNRLSALSRSGVEEEQVDRIQDLLFKSTSETEKGIVKFLDVENQKVAIYQKFLKSVRGIGTILSAGLISSLDPAKAPHVSSFWKYAGLSVVNGKADGKVRGEKISYNPFLKTLCFKIGESFVKVKGQGRNLYAKYRLFYASKPPCERCAALKDLKTKLPLTKCSDMHVHRRAKRKAVKLFLSALWQKWREIEKLPTEPAYPFVHLVGHSDLITPEMWMEKGRES